MNKKIILLGGLLVLQAVLVVFTSFQSKGLLGHSGMQALLEFNREQVDRIVLSDSTQQVELLRGDDGWVTAEDFPVEVDRVDRLLERLKGLEHGLVIAQTEAALKRFKLTEATCERQVQLFSDGKPVVELMLGSGAGARRSHVRVGGARDVYAVALGGYDLPVDLGQWQDKSLLKLNPGVVQSVQIGDLTVIKDTVEASGSDAASAGAAESTDAEPESEVAWVAADLADGEQFEVENFKRDLDRLLGLSYTRAYARGDLTELAKSEEAANQITLQLTDGRSRSYQFFESKEGEMWLIQVSDHDAIFEVSSYLGSRFGEQMLAEKLVKELEPEAVDVAESDGEALSDSEDNTIHVEPTEAVTVPGSESVEALDQEESVEPSEGASPATGEADAS
ncbi:DUF4340 domain-containing protein [Coraliomargarita sp. SDUM461004]|uniref:DUF4340 domain-containing protein n=1 Tax=Thalassobacterium sedimentorum TaxID=3041258 RepID=A0ABU1AI64_9BACT|nr:DUF4340 domain-containing protein [Coraliomargarita sp. SDUM461004]MDQ8194475.1 DUF4340 domain-containing protein [Coraliomargarita sp. SDUM461004]